MRRKSIFQSARMVSVLTLILAMTAITGMSSTPASAQRIEIRPIQEFVDAQGTFCIDDSMGGCFLFVPPVENFLFWNDPAKETLAAVDYAGLADDFLGGALGTEIAGTVIERELPDGRAEIRVVLHTSNALTWVADGIDLTGPLLFGHRAPDVLNGADAALGSSFFEVRFINPAPGAPLPDLLQLLFAPAGGQEGPSFFAFRARADGKFPDDTLGRATVVQTGLFMTGFMGAVGDGFPVENINLQPVGN